MHFSCECPLLLNNTYLGPRKETIKQYLSWTKKSNSYLCKIPFLSQTLLNNINHSFILCYCKVVLVHDNEAIFESLKAILAFLYYIFFIIYIQINGPNEFYKTIQNK